MSRNSQIEWQRTLSCNQPGGPVEGQIQPRPLSHDQQAILKLDDVKKMDKTPNQQCRQSQDLKPIKIGDCCNPADGRKISFIEIVERWKFLTAKSGAN